MVEWSIKFIDPPLSIEIDNLVSFTRIMKKI